eukprot:652846-Amphidinium_carterae.1
MKPCGGVHWMIKRVDGVCSCEVSIAPLSLFHELVRFGSSCSLGKKGLEDLRACPRRRGGRLVSRDFHNIRCSSAAVLVV